MIDDGVQVDIRVKLIWSDWMIKNSNLYGCLKSRRATGVMKNQKN